MARTSMDTTNFAEVAERAVAMALQAGAGACDVLIEEGREFRADVLDGNPENIKQARTRGLGLRVLVEQRVAVVFTSDLRDDSLRDLSARAVQLARQSSPDEFAGLPDGALAATNAVDPLQMHDEALLRLSVDERIAMALEMERVARGYDPRIVRLDGCTVVTREGSATLASSNGGVLSYRGTGISLYCNPLADDEGGRQQSGSYGASARSLAKVETPEEVAREGARRAVERIGARSVPTQKVPVILHPDIASSWIANLHDAFSGEDVYKETSYLTGKLAETIATPGLTLVDDGLLPGGTATAPFDGEGQPTRKNVLLERGVCTMYLYDSYWARKAKTRSTGSAVRGFTGVPGIGHRNLYLENGDTSPEAIRKSVDKGFYMVDQGAFGFNATTGDYSYQAAGFWIEKGEIAFPVQEITVASNTLQMLKNVVKIGNDLKFNGSVNAPTLLIAEMTLSGSVDGKS